MEGTHGGMISSSTFASNEESWTSGQEGKLHQQVRGFRDQSLSDGREEHHARAAVDCVDGLCDKKFAQLRGAAKTAQPVPISAWGARSDLGGAVVSNQNPFAQVQGIMLQGVANQMSGLLAFMGSRSQRNLRHHASDPRGKLMTIEEKERLLADKIAAYQSGESEKLMDKRVAKRAPLIRRMAEAQVATLTDELEHEAHLDDTRSPWADWENTPVSMPAGMRGSHQ